MVDKEDPQILSSFTIVFTIVYQSFLIVKIKKQKKSLQVIYIIWEFCIYECFYLLRFICGSKISTSSNVMVISDNVPSVKKLSRSTHVPSWRKNKRACFQLSYRLCSFQESTSDIFYVHFCAVFWWFCCLKRPPTIELKLLCLCFYV